MKLEPREIADGLHNGKEVWICDYRFKDFDNKPIRHVEPKKVTIISIEETDKTVYYSDSYFREGDKKSSVIKLFDNTGYRSYAGVPLQVFTEEVECREAYSAAKKKLQKEFQQYKEAILHRLDRIEKELQ